MYNLNINKKIKNNLNLIYKERKKINSKNKSLKGCLDKNYINKKKNFSSPPFQYFSINYYNFSETLDSKTKKKIQKEVKFLLSLQNDDGSYDEWYKNERSFCTTSYSSFLISNLLLENNKLDPVFKKKLTLSLEKSFNFLRNKFNKNILNQNLAKLIFLINFAKIDNNKNEIILSELSSHLNRVYDTVINSNEHEYKGIDLGYLTISLMLSAEILKKKNCKKTEKIFLRLLKLSKSLTLNFNYFPSYIFSRSSRIFLIYGFYFAVRQNFINPSEFRNIYKFYNENFTLIYNSRNFRYLSFFYSTDKVKVLLDNSKKIFNKKYIDKKIKKIDDYLTFINKDIKIFIYKKNPNIIAFIIKGKIKILLCNFLVFSNKKYLPVILKNIKILDKKILIKQKFIKINNLKNIAFRFITLISILSQIKILNKFIDYFAKYFLIIKKKENNNFKKFRTIYIKDKKFFIKEIIISDKSKYYITPNFEAHYFSPTSFLLKNEILRPKKMIIKELYKMNKKVLLTTYEF